MENNQHSTKEYFKIISFIHLAILLSVVLFGIVVYFFAVDFKHPDIQSELAKLLVFIVPGLVIAGIISSNIIFRVKLNAIMGSEDLKVKMAVYRESLIIRYMLLEGPALLALAAIFITNNSNFMVYAGLLVVLMATKRPTKRSAIADLALDQQEIAVLEDPYTTF
jgi:hypothetical protein